MDHGAVLELSPKLSQFVCFSLKLLSVQEEVLFCMAFTLLAEAFPLCFSALYCHSLRGFGCSRFVLVVSVPRKRPLPTAACDSC